MRLKTTVKKISDIPGILTVVALAVLLVVFSNTSEYFFTSQNMLAILLSASTVSFIGIGQFMNVLCGYFDMSVGNVAAMSGVIYALLVKDAGMSVPLAIMVSLFFGLFSGAIAGFCVSRLNTNAWVTTFALMQIYRGILFVLTGGQSITLKNNEAFRFLGTYKLFGFVQMPIALMIILFVFFFLLLRYTRIGRSVYCVGNNQEAAHISGLDVANTKLFCFLVTGFMAALSGIVFTARINSAQPNLGATYAMDTIAAAVVGGTRMGGGRGNIWGAFVGIIIVYVIQNGLIMSGLDSYYHYIATGLIMFFAVLSQTERIKK